MQKIRIFLAVMVLVLSLCACGQKSAIQQATGADAKQNRAIEDIIEEAGIAYEMINEARHNRPETPMPENCEVYNLIDANGKSYFMVLNENHEVVVLMDSEENLLWGNF